MHKVDVSGVRIEFHISSENKTIQQVKYNTHFLKNRVFCCGFTNSIILTSIDTHRIRDKLTPDQLLQKTLDTCKTTVLNTSLVSDRFMILNSFCMYSNFSPNSFIRQKIMLPKTRLGGQIWKKLTNVCSKPRKRFIPEIIWWKINFVNQWRFIFQVFFKNCLDLVFFFFFLLVFFVFFIFNVICKLERSVPVSHAKTKLKLTSL